MINIFRKNTAIKIHPDYSEAYFLLGKIYRRTGQFDLAVKAFIKCTQLKPQQASYLEMLGISLFENKEFNKAEKIFNKSLIIDNNNPYVFFTLGNIYALAYNKVERTLAFFLIISRPEGRGYFRQLTD